MTYAGTSGGIHLCSDLKIKETRDGLENVFNTATDTCMLRLQLSGQLNKHPEEELEGEATAAELHRVLSSLDLTTISVRTLLIPPSSLPKPRFIDTE